MKRLTREQVAAKLEKMPKWVQDGFKDVCQERDSAVRALREFCDDQTPSPFYVEDFVCDGDSETGRGPSTRKHYIQTRSIEIEHADVSVRVLLRDDNIEISYAGINRALEDVVMQPKSYQSISLFRVGAVKQR